MAGGTANDFARAKDLPLDSRRPGALARDAAAPPRPWSSAWQGEPAVRQRRAARAVGHRRARRQAAQVAPSARWPTPSARCAPRQRRAAALHGHAATGASRPRAARGRSSWRSPARSAAAARSAARATGRRRARRRGRTGRLAGGARAPRVRDARRPPHGQSDVTHARGANDRGRDARAPRLQRRRRDCSLRAGRASRPARRRIRSGDGP